MQSLWILAGTFLTVLTYVFVKLTPHTLGVADIFFVRSVFLALVLYGLARASGVALGTLFPRLHLLRTGAGVSALLLNIVAVQGLPIATSQTLFATSPLFVGAWMAVRKYVGARSAKASGDASGEAFDRRSLAAILLGFLGVYLTLCPTFHDEDGLFALVALGAAICAAISGLALRRLGSAGEPVFRTAFYFGYGSLVTAAILWWATSDTPVETLVTTPELLAVGLCTVGAQLAQTQGWSRGRPLLCANLQFSGILFSTLFGLFLFKDEIGPGAFLGMALIVLSEATAGYVQVRNARKRA